MEKHKNNLQTVAVATLGCKVNQSESASFASGFEARGLAVGPFDKPADIYVINTCAVTAKAAAQSRQLVRRAQRTNPRARIIVTGCYAQIAPEKIQEIEPAPIAIVGNANKHHVIEVALSDLKHAASCSQPQSNKFFDDLAAHKEISRLPVRRFSNRTRAFLKIQDGCNSFCSYCIVPYARGRSRSLALDMVLHQALQFAAEGHKEIVLTGIHIGYYGLDLQPSVNLLDLLQGLCSETPGVRYRLSSLEPAEISGRLLDFMASADNFMPHLHIPLQSGSDAILKKMNRGYSARQFSEKVRRCKEMIPEAAIGVDVLVGFPGETEDDFLQTYDLIKDLPVTYLHVFPYSKRPGTPAAKLAQQIPADIKEERVAILRKLDHKKRIFFYGSRLDAVHPVLVETDKSGDGFAKGFTDNYIPVRFEADRDVAHRIVQVRLDRLQERHVIGTLL